MPDIESTINTIANYLGQNGFKILLSIFVFFVAIKLINYLANLLLNFLNSKHLDQSLVNPIVLIVKYASYLIVLIILASFLGLDTSALLTILVLVAIVLIVAMQTTLANIGGGIMLLAIKPFSDGNFVEINGKEGYVKEIGLYHTLLTQRDNSVIFVPNSEVLNTEIINMEKRRKRRVDIDIYVRNDSDFDVIRKISLDAIKGDKRIIKDPQATFVVREIKPYGSKVRTRLWVKKSDYWDVLYDYNEKFLQAYKKANINFPDVKISYSTN